MTLIDPRAVLLDIDGCVVRGIGQEALPGAAAAVTEIRRRRPLRFVTNTTSRTRSWLVGSLREAGFTLDDNEVVTPASLAHRVLTARGEAGGVLLADTTAMDDLDWYEPEPPERARSVLVASESHERRIGDLREAVVALRRGARLYTLQQNRIYTRDGCTLTDLGPVAAFLGYAADVGWENLGKPSPLLFAALADELGCRPAELAMVGDDAEFDVAGALTADVGLGVLVRTGKYRPGDETRFVPPPSLVVDSIADLPDRLPRRPRSTTR